MATNTQLRPLNEVVDYLKQQHAQDQETIADNLVLAMYPLWHIVDFNELDKTSVLWTESVLPRIKTAYLQSQQVAAVFAANLRFASLAEADPMPIITQQVEVPIGVDESHFTMPDFGDTDVEPVKLDPFPEDDVRLSMMVAGNFDIKAKMPVDEVEAMADARTNSTGAGVRQALKGARNVTANVLKFDRKVLGYARFTDSNPCFFCALLASRGAVYGKHSFVDSDKGFVAPKDAPDVPADFVNVSKVHDHCRCTLRPVYSKSQEFDSDAKFYRSQWNAVQKQGGSPEEVLKRWRSSYKPFQRTASDVSDIRAALSDRADALVAKGFGVDSPQVKWAQSLLA